MPGDHISTGTRHGKGYHKLCPGEYSSRSHDLEEGRSKSVVFGDETLVKDFSQMLQEYDDTLLMWNVNAANKNSNPAMCVLLTFLVDFAVHQNIMACKALTYNY